MANKSVLIIDGDAASRAFLEMTFRKSGLTVLQTGLGREGLIFAWRDRPDLIVADPNLPDLPGETLVAKIRQDARTSQTPCIALSSDPNPERKAACLSAGFNEYLVKSAQAIPPLLEAITRLLSGKPVTGISRQGGMLFVFLSAKGGTGTSSLCANIATNIVKNEPESNVAVADLVLPIGSIGQIVGYQGEMDLFSVSELPAEQATDVFLRENLPKPPLWDFQLLAGCPDPEKGTLLQAKRVPELVSKLQQAFDYVLVDLGRSLSRISLPIIQQADVIVLIVSTDLSTVTLTQKVLEYLKAQGIKSERVYTILNRAVGLEGLTKPEAEKILGIDIQVTLPYMGSNFTLANNQHQPIIHKFPNDTTSISLKQISTDLAALARRLRTA
jgi:pilus assembly protein CpaE